MTNFNRVAKDVDSLVLFILGEKENENQCELCCAYNYCKDHPVEDMTASCASMIKGWLEQEEEDE